MPRRFIQIYRCSVSVIIGFVCYHLDFEFRSFIASGKVFLSHVLFFLFFLFFSFLSIIKYLGAFIATVNILVYSRDWT